jgi:hypothetical protein
VAWACLRFGEGVEALEALEGDAARAVRRVVEPLADADDAERGRVVEQWRRQDRRWDSPEEWIVYADRDAVTRQTDAMSARWTRALEHLFEDRSRSPRGGHSVRTARAIVAIATRPLRETVNRRRPELRVDDGFDFDLLSRMESHPRQVFLRRLGVFQLAELARKQDRRSLVRLRRALEPDDRGWFDECIRRERDVERLERVRLRELFLAVSRQEPDLVARLLHLGLYTIAAAAGKRFSSELEQVARQLPSTLRTLLLHYHRADLKVSMASLAAACRRALDEFVARRPGDATTGSIHARDGHHER